MKENHLIDPPKKSRKLLYLLVTILILFSFTLSLPSLLSTDLGKTLLSKYLSHKLQGTLILKELHLSWFHSQTLEGFSYTDRKSSLSLQFEKLLIEDSLFSLMNSKKKQGLTTLSSPMLTVNTSTFSFAPSSPNPLMILLSNFLAQNATLRFLEVDHNTVAFQHLDVRLEIGTPSLISIKGETLFNEKVGTINLSTLLKDDYLLPRLLGSSQTLPAIFQYEASLQAKDAPSFFIEEGLSLIHPKARELSRNLLGETFDIDSRFKYAKDNLSLGIEFNSSDMKSSLHLITQSGQLALSKPALLQGTLTQNILQLFIDKEAMQLASPSVWTLRLDDLKIPYHGTLDLKHLAYKAYLNTSPLQLTHGSNTVTIRALSCNSSSENAANNLTLSFQSTLQDRFQKEAYANTFCRLNLKALSSPDDALVTDLKADISRLPTFIVDALSNTKGKLNLILGETLSLKITPSPNRAFTYTLYLSTPRFTLPETPLLIKDTLQTTAPIPFSFDPKLLPSLFDSSSSIKVIQTTSLRGTLQNFHLVLSPPLEKLENRLDCQLTFNPIHLEVAASLGPHELSLDNTSCSITAAHFDALTLKSSASVSYLNNSTLKNLFWGKPLNMHLNAIIDLKDSKPISLPFFEYFVQSDTLNLSAKGSLTENLSLLTFSEPLSLQFLPSLPFLQILTRNNPFLSYNAYVPLKAMITLQPLDLHKTFFDNCVGEVALSLEKSNIINNTFHQEYSFLDTNINLSANAKTKTFSCLVVTHPQYTSNNPQPSLMEVEFSSSDFSSFDFFKKNLHIKTLCKKIPIGLLDALLDKKDLMTALLGEDFTSDMALDKNQTLSWHGSIQSQNLSLSSNLELTDSALQSNTDKPLIIDYTLTPNAYLALQQLTSPSLPSFELKDSASLHGEIHKLFLKRATPSLSSEQTLPKRFNDYLLDSLFEFSLSLQDFNVRPSAKHPSSSMQQLSLEGIKTQNPNTAIFNLDIKSLDTSAKEGLCKMTLTFTPSKATLIKPLLYSKGHAQFESFPSSLTDALCRLLPLHGITPSKFLGKTFNATLSTSLENTSGNIDATLDGTSAQAELHAYLNEGVLKLAQPLQASIDLTSPLVDSFLSNMNLKLALAKKPLQLSIDSQGFYMPLMPLDLPSTRLRKASLNFGEIFCDNLGSSQDISSFFKLSTPSNAPISLWFAPLDFSLNQGTVTVERTEVLFERGYQIAFWGKVNFLKQYVNMILGLTEQSLKKALGIHGLPHNFVLQIPVEGPFNHVRINKELATARIAFLLAKSSGLTRQGGVFGNIVDLLGDMANDQRNTPPPRPPFPWDKALSLFEEEEKRNTTVHIIH